MLTTDNTVLVLVDVQGKLTQAMDGREALTQNLRKLVQGVQVFGLPILDTSVAVIRRLLNHRPLFVSDRGHIYDQMIDRGIPLRKTVAICYGVAALYALIGLAMSQIRTRYAAGVYILVFGVSAVVVWQRGYLKMHGLRGAVPQEQSKA